MSPTTRYDIHVQSLHVSRLGSIYSHSTVTQYAHFAPGLDNKGLGSAHI